MEGNKLKEIKKQSRAGRKSAILFDNDWNRHLFDSAAKIMLEKYYDHSPENTKKNIVFPGFPGMGKTLFWACIHLICRKDNIINNGELTHNLEPFVEHLTDVFGKDVIGDRSAIQKMEKLLKDYEAHRYNKVKLYKTNADKKEAEKYDRLFRTVNKYWEEAVMQIKNCNFAT